MIRLYQYLTDYAVHILFDASNKEETMITLLPLATVFRCLPNVKHHTTIYMSWRNYRKLVCSLVPIDIDSDWFMCTLDDVLKAAKYLSTR